MVSKSYDHGGEGIAAKTVSYTYDGMGNTMGETTRNGDTISYSYDIHGRKIAVYTNGVQAFSYTYDNNGNLITETDESGTTTYTYDGTNRVLSKTVTGLIGQTDSYTMTYAYDITEGLEEG